MRISQPLKQRGKRTLEWEKWRQRTRAIVTGRCRGKCEASWTSDLPLDIHHLFNRQDEPWSSYPACVIAVTRNIHNDLERELLPSLHDHLRWAALRNLAAEFGELEWFEMTLPLNSTPLSAWRQLVQQLNDKFEYDAALNAVVAR